MSDTSPSSPDAADPPLPPRTIRRLASSFYIALGAAGLIWVRVRTGHWLPESVTGGDIGSSLLMGLGLGVLVILLTGPLIHRLSWMHWLSLEMRRLLGPVDLGTAVVVALASGIGEEVLFRGALLPVTGLVPSSLIFALLHTGPDRRYLAWTVFSLAVGLGLGGIVVVTGNLLGAVLAHVLINVVNLWRIGRMKLPEVDNLESRASVPE